MLAVSPGRPRPIKGRAEGNYVRIDVADNGMGIAAADLPHVFERFWRAAGVTAPGAGLGLANVCPSPPSAPAARDAGPR
jgi:two-component system sensor histidine kinase MprB